jgi:hypothetical protein
VTLYESKFKQGSYYFKCKNPECEYSQKYATDYRDVSTPQEPASSVWDADVRIPLKRQRDEQHQQAAGTVTAVGGKAPQPLPNSVDALKNELLDLRAHVDMLGTNWADAEKAQIQEIKDINSRHGVQVRDIVETQKHFKIVLETRVADLERECARLQREIDYLKRFTGTRTFAKGKNVPDVADEEVTEDEGANEVNV